MLDNEQDKNYERAPNEIEKFIGKPLSHSMIEEIHTLIESGKPSIYRTGWGFPPVRNPLTRKVIYSPPNGASYSIKKEVSDMIDAYNSSVFSSDAEGAAQLHWWFVKIHPFEDGNGRTARLLMIYALHSSDYDDRSCRNFEKYFSVNRQDYDNSLDDQVSSYRKLSKVSDRFVRYLETSLD